MAKRTLKDRVNVAWRLAVIAASALLGFFVGRELFGEDSAGQIVLIIVLTLVSFLLLIVRPYFKNN